MTNPEPNKTPDKPQQRLLRQLDFREVGRLMGTPLYIDVAALPNEQTKSARHAMITNLLTQQFTPPKRPKQ